MTNEYESENKNEYIAIPTFLWDFIKVFQTKLTGLLYNSVQFFCESTEGLVYFAKSAIVTKWPPNLLYKVERAEIQHKKL